MSKKPKTINGLMKHLRSNGVNIKNSKQKTQLINQGYYHGYKGYRFYKESSRKLPITDYEQINQTILYDCWVIITCRSWIIAHLLFCTYNQYYN